MSGQPPHTPPADRARIGRWVVRAGYAFTFAVVGASILESILAWGATSSVALLACTAALWLASGVIAYGRLLRGELAAFSVGRGLAALPVSLGCAYYSPAIEHAGRWWALLLPHLTFGLLRHGLGLPHLCALLLTILVALPELMLTAAVTQAVVIAPLTAIFGADSPIVESARDQLGGITVSDEDPLHRRSGLEESTVWGGRTELD
jgi:hypothetical protein